MARPRSSSSSVVLGSTLAAWLEVGFSDASTSGACVVSVRSNVWSIPHLVVCGIGLDIRLGSGKVQMKGLGLALDTLDLLARMLLSALDSLRRPASVTL